MTRQRGFTIVEVMVALLVIGLTYAGVIEALGRFADERLAIKSRLPAYQVAWNRSVIEHLQGSGWLLDNASGGIGEEPLDGRVWRWERSRQSLGAGITLTELTVFAESEKTPTASMKVLGFE